MNFNKNLWSTHAKFQNFYCTYLRSSESSLSHSKQKDLRFIYVSQLPFLGYKKSTYLHLSSFGQDFLWVNQLDSQLSREKFSCFPRFEALGGFCNCRPQKGHTKFCLPQTCEPIEKIGVRYSGAFARGISFFFQALSLQVSSPSPNIKPVISNTSHSVFWVVTRCFLNFKQNI